MKTLYTINQKKHATHTNITIGDPETSLQNICVTGRDHAKHAVLIEAAPYMLEALVLANQTFNDHFGITDNDEAGNHAHDEIRETIKKAQP